MSSLSKRVAAFTLVELMAVIVLMTILMSIGIVAFRGVQATAAEQAVAEVMTVLRHARQYAISNNRPTYVIFPHDSGDSNMYDNLTAKKRFLRSYAVYAAGEGIISEWNTLPEGLLFHPTKNAALASEKNVLTDAAFDEVLPYPDPDGIPTVTFQAIKFKPDGTAPYITNSKPALTLAEGFTNADTNPSAASLNFTETSKQTYFYLVVQPLSGEIFVREVNS